jgi:NADP-dependent 3-hydroxy acid dehydrogenase YdfG
MSEQDASASERWRGRVALVTGASSGIGRAIAERLAIGEGMKVAICARRSDRLAELSKSIRARVPKAELVAIACDLRDEAAIARMFAAIRARFGGVDVLINNAGLGRDAPLMSGATADWREMLELNVLAPCICSREAIADMRQRGDNGHVIHIASMAAHRVPPGSGVYSASKFALRSLTEGLRMELRAAGSDIRITAISPGYVETEFAQNYAHGDAEHAQRTYSKFPVLQPGDIADMVAYALRAPAHVQIHDLLVRPTRQPS